MNIIQIDQTPAHQRRKNEAAYRRGKECADQGLGLLAANALFVTEFGLSPELRQYFEAGYNGAPFYPSQSHFYPSQSQ